MPKLRNMQVITNPQQIDRQAWQQLIDNSPTATWFQTPAAYDFYASLPDLMTPFVFAVEHEEVLMGVVVGYVTQEKSALKQFLTRRAIINGGPMLKDGISSEMLELLLNAVRKELSTQAIYIETRNFNDYSVFRSVFEKCGFLYHPHYDIFIDCDDKMQTRISDSKQRQLRKSLNEGTVIEPARNADEVRAWYAELKKLYTTKVKRPLWDVSFFLTAWQREDFVLLLVKKTDGTITGGILCPILSSDTIYEWYICGSALSTYAAMDYARSHGIKKLDLMGAGVPGKPYGVRDFKIQMGGQLQEYGRFLYVSNKLLYYLGKTAISLIY